MMPSMERITLIINNLLTNIPTIGYFGFMKLNLSEFKSGQLCYVVLRRHKGRGPLKLILHEAVPHPNGFGYGHGKAWLVSPPHLMGCSRSPKKAAAARLNGIKGGRPKTT